MVILPGTQRTFAKKKLLFSFQLSVTVLCVLSLNIILLIHQKKGKNNEPYKFLDKKKKVLKKS